MSFSLVSRILVFCCFKTRVTRVPRPLEIAAFGDEMTGDERDPGERKPTTPAATGSRSIFAPLLLGVLLVGVGIGVGVGVGYGIWHSDGSTGTSDSLRGGVSSSCPDGEHADPLVTIVLPLRNVSVASLDVTEIKGVQGSFGELSFPRAGVPEDIGSLTNAPLEGRLYRDVLNATEFLEDWASLSGDLQNSSSFFQPAGAARKQCRTGNGLADPDGVIMGPDSIRQNVSPNAMIRFDSDPSSAFVVDIFDVRVADGGQGYVMTFRLAPEEAATQPAKEGQCHPMLELDRPHYHHVSLCMDTIGALDVPAATGGDGAMVFVNTGGCLQPPVFADGGTVPL